MLIDWCYFYQYYKLNNNKIMIIDTTQAMLAIIMSLVILFLNNLLLFLDKCWFDRSILQFLHIFGWVELRQCSQKVFPHPFFEQVKIVRLPVALQTSQVILLVWTMFVTSPVITLSEIFMLLSTMLNIKSH